MNENNGSNLSEIFKRLNFSDSSKSQSTWKDLFRGIQGYKKNQGFLDLLDYWLEHFCQDDRESGDGGDKIFVSLVATVDRNVRLNLYRRGVTEGYLDVEPYLVKAIIAGGDSRFSDFDRNFLKIFWPAFGHQDDGCYLLLPAIGIDQLLSELCEAKAVLMLAHGNLNAITFRPDLAISPIFTLMLLDSGGYQFGARLEFAQAEPGGSDIGEKFSSPQILGDKLVLAGETLGYLPRVTNQRDYSAWIDFFLTRSAISIPSAELVDFLTEVLSHCWPARWQLSDGISVIRENAKFEPQLYLKTAFNFEMQQVEALISYAYDRLQFPSRLFAQNSISETPEQLIGIEVGGLDRTEIRLFCRDWDYEAELESYFQQTMAKGLRFTASGMIKIPTNSLEKSIYQLLDQGWTIWVENLKLKILDDFFIQVTSDMDWFELKMKFVDKNRSISPWQLINLLKRKSMFIRLDDGSVGILPEKWLLHLRSLGSLAIDHEGQPRLPAIAAGIFSQRDQEESELQRLQLDDFAKALKDRVENFHRFEENANFSAVKVELKPYQVTGVQWLEFLHSFRLGGCLADEMGLGKTVQILAWLAHLKTKGQQQDNLGVATCSLIICPKLLVSQLRDEAAAMTPSLQVGVLNVENFGEMAQLIAKCDLVIASYGLVVSRIVQLKTLRFSYIILDEAQLIKNFFTKRYQAVIQLQSSYKVALTGTPIENHLGELAAILQFLNPNLFPAFQWHQEKNNFHLFKRAIRPLILRRTKADVLDLPHKAVTTVKLPLSAQQQEIYKAIHENLVRHLAKDEASVQFFDKQSFFLESLLRLRQVCCHPGLIDEYWLDREESSTKIMYLLGLAPQLKADGHRAIVFSQFSSFLMRIAAAFTKNNISYVYLDGQTTQRDEVINKFRSDSSITFFLIGLRAGGFGINLTEADHCFLMEPWWNSAVENQAIDRIHRIGQEKKVYISRLIIENSVEEKIHELQLKKEVVMNDVLVSDQESLTQLTKEDLTSILGL